MKKLLAEFKTFINRGNVIDLAVGVMIGAAFKAIVDSLVGDIISPLLGLFGGNDLGALSATIAGVPVNYGAFISAIINFLMIAFVLMLFVKAVNKSRELAHRRKKAEEAAEEATTKKCPFCCSEIAIEATRCPHCTSELDK